MLEYLDLIRSNPTPLRMVKGHAFKMLGMAPDQRSRPRLPPRSRTA